ncbi:hypothetical protein CF15_07555 [Pyrodictium occultum]|uniref:Uncharacterized protein n=1 Tax=Pyrodictium occultum TaxID=2309 RepID=A0A0V8RWZ7_PYROC|nr:hypothetical protein [Pyrodictium occultum]KSW12561.1 hypothetical protein CF15_07555 [Pyrodictium occultum]
MSSRKGARKLIAVPEEILQELSVIAKRSGLTISELASLILSFAARALHGRDNIASLFTEMTLLTDMRRLGGVIVPQKGLVELVNSADPSARDTFIKEVGRLATSIAVFAKVRGLDDILTKDIISLFVPNASIEEINDGNSGKIIISITEKPYSGMLDMLKTIATSVLEAMGKRVEKIDEYDSILVINYRQSS